MTQSISRVGVALGLLSIVQFGVTSLSAQGPSTSQSPTLSAGNTAPAIGGDRPAWGLSSDIVYTVSAYDFQLLEGTPGAINPITWGFTCQVAFCDWVVGVQLPNGASIRSIELSACDSDPAGGQVGTSLLRSPKIPGALIPLFFNAVTGGDAAPGCASFLSTQAITHTVNNDTSVYLLHVTGTVGNAGPVHWNQVRIRYRLQVSPAPGAATFADVPVGNPYHQFVEALVASGITGGCGGGNYCPDAPVTRAQMAVFLAAALGLHWPN